jgi:hypothetical protein
MGDAFTIADRLSTRVYQSLSSVWHAISFPACHNAVPGVLRFDFGGEIDALSWSVFEGTGRIAKTDRK